MWPRGVGVTVEMGRASFVGSSGGAAVHKRDGCARRQAPPRAKLRMVKTCLEGTAPSGGWIGPQRRREIERRCAGYRRVELTLLEKICFQISTPKAARSISFWGRGGGEPTGKSGNLSTRDNNGRRTAHGDPRSARTPSREQQSSNFIRAKRVSN